MDFSPIISLAVPFMICGMTFASIVYLLLPALDWQHRTCRHFTHHDYKEVKILRWEHCSICEHELNEPNKAHPIKLYKCSKCGKEVEDMDYFEEKTMD